MQALFVIVHHVDRIRIPFSGHRVVGVIADDSDEDDAPENCKTTTKRIEASSGTNASVVRKLRKCEDQHADPHKYGKG